MSCTTKYTENRLLQFSSGYFGLFQLTLETKIYKTVVRPVLTHGAETWATINRNEETTRLFDITEMRMLRWIDIINA